MKRLLADLGLARSALYLAEGLPLQWIHRSLSGRWGREYNPPKEFNQAAFKAGQKLIQLDAERASQGLYPVSLLLPGSAKSHLKSLGEVWWDGIKVAWRMRQGQHDDLKAVDPAELANAPDYFKRNFHFQTDGYFSEGSAARYDHQVEILFKGAAAAMRRLALVPLVEEFRSQTNAKLIEVAAGQLSTTKQVAATLPNVRITATDLSSQYLGFARTQLKSDQKIDLLQANGSDLPFKPATYDGWYSVFLFHELPKAERKKVLKEAFRVLKPGGLLVIVDSIQWDDNPELNWGLKTFPIDFHEPFYKDYVHSPLAPMIEAAGFTVEHQEQGLLSKCISARKPLKPSS